MQFEILDDDHEAGRVIFEGDEHNLVSSAILNALIKSAVVGGTQLENNNLIILLPTHSGPEYTKIRSIEANAHHFDALAGALSANLENTTYDRAGEIGRLIAQLQVAATIIRNNSTPKNFSNEAINKIMLQVNTPDSPEGLS